MCGVFGITGHPLAKNFLVLAMRALQHRGHDGAGVAGLISEEPRCVETVKGVGKVTQILTPERLSKFEGTTYIGHTRYATRNPSTSSREIHPHWAQSLQGRMAIVSNGDLLDVPEHRDYLESLGVKTYTSNDAEMIAGLVNYETHVNKNDIVSSILATIPRLKGGYAALMMVEQNDLLIAFRDPWGIRPLHLAEFGINDQKFVVFSSETCSFDIIKRYGLSQFPSDDFSYSQREVLPGEVVTVNPKGEIRSTEFLSTPSKNQGCVFESIYFSRPDSMMGGTSFQTQRELMGKELYKEAPIEADLVTAVPKGGIPSAVGFAKASGANYSVAILEEPSTGGIRSFTTNDNDRHSLASLKYNILADVVKGKKLVVVDDSIVRGTTMRLLVKSLFDAGALEVHLRIPCPPYSYPCNYGIETKDPTSLISHGKEVPDICNELGATSLAYLSIEGLYKALGKKQELFCDECLSGKSPIRPLENIA